MVAGSFSTYDIIVDTIPGILFLILIAPILPDPWIQQLPVLYSGSLRGVFFVILGYPTGRILHGIGSILGGTLLWFRRRVVPQFDRPLTNMKKIIRTSPNTFFVLLGGRLYRLISRLDVKSQKEYIFEYYNQYHTVGEDLSAEIGLNESVLEDTVEALSRELETDLKTNPHEIESAIYFGQNRLYPKQTLYRKYQIIHTFYKNLATGFLILGVSYYAISEGALEPSLPESFPLFESSVVLFGIATICYIRQTKWRRSTHRAYFNDLQSEL